MVGELKVVQPPIPDARQDNPNSKFYRTTEESKPYYQVNRTNKQKYKTISN